LARVRWLERRKAELLPVEYFHVVFTVPEPIANIAFYNKDAVYDILFRTTAQTLLTIARDPARLGVEAGFFAVLHTWGQNLHFHPHLHCVVPGGGLSPDGKRWIRGRRRFFLPVQVLSALFRRLFPEALEKAFADGQLRFFGDLEPLRDPSAFARFLAPLKKSRWVVYAKAPFGGPQHVLEYLGRYTHRVAISNRRLLALENGQVSFQYYGLLANCHRDRKLDLCRQLLTPCSDLLPRPADYGGLNAALTGMNLRLCPECGVGILVRLLVLPPQRRALPALTDTS
jgi:hypothetical protein